MSEKNKGRSAMDLLTNHLLETIATAPDEELAKLLEESGNDIAELDRGSKAAFAAALKAHGQNKRQALNRQAAQVRATRSRRIDDLPRSKEELLTLLRQLQARGVVEGRPVSLHHRELTNMPDDELRTFIADLIDLQSPDLPKE